MPFSLRMEDGVVLGTCSGVLGLDEAMAGAKAVWDNPDWRGKPVVWDFRAAELNADASGVGALARFVLEGQPSPPPSRVALVTARNVDFGMARMFETLREHPATGIRVFRDYEHAISWASGTDA